MSMNDLARYVDIDQGLLSKIECGLRPPPQIVPYVQRIASKLGLAPDSNPYRELMDAAFKERFGHKPKGGPGGIIVVGLADQPSRGLAGLPPSLTPPDSPAGRYYKSLGIDVGADLTKQPSATNQPQTGGPLPERAWPQDLSLQAIYLLAQMGISLTRLEASENNISVELRLPDGREFTVSINPKRPKETGE